MVIIRNRKRTPCNCPRCGSPRRIPWAYGMPTPKIEEKAGRGEVLLGGCCIEEGDPSWHCVSCDFDWGKEKPPLLLFHTLEPYKETFRKVAMLRIVAELIRRHGHPKKLLALEIHPSMGQSYAVALYQKIGPGRIAEVCTLGCDGIFASIGDDREPFPYIRLLRDTHHPIDVVNALEDYLEFPHHSRQKPWDAPSFMFHLMAVIVEAYSGSIDFSCGWWDSSGYEGSYVSDEIKRQPVLEPKGGWGRDNWQADMLAAANYWLLRITEEHRVSTPAIFDLGGKVWRTDGSGDCLAVHEEFTKAGERLQPVMEKLGCWLDCRE